MNRKEVSKYINKKLESNILEKTILFYGENKDLFKEEILNFSAKILCIDLFSSDEIKKLKTKPIKNLKISPNFFTSYDEKEEKIKQIKIGEVKDFFSDIKYKGEKNKVYILDDADFLNINAQNAILKIIEEPPKGVYIFLIASGIDSILNTIKSRCTKIYLSSEDDEELNILENNLKSKELNEFLNIFSDALKLKKLNYISKYNKIIDKTNISKLLDNLEYIFIYSLNKESMISPASEVVFNINKKRSQNVNQNILKEEIILGIYNYINLNKTHKIKKYKEVEINNINNFEEIVYK